MCVQNLKLVALPDSEIIGVPQKTREVPGYAHVPSSQKFLMGFDQFSSDAYYECTCQVISPLPVPELIGGSQKLGRFLAMPTLSIPPPHPKNPICLPYRLFIYVHSSSRDFRMQF